MMESCAADLTGLPSVSADGCYSGKELDKVPMYLNLSRSAGTRLCLTSPSMLTEPNTLTAMRILKNAIFCINCVHLVL
jgi:hypothetical protein